MTKGELISRNNCLFLRGQCPNCQGIKENLMLSPTVHMVNCPHCQHEYEVEIPSPCVHCTSKKKEVI